MKLALLKGFHYDTVDSTMEEAKRLIRNGEIQDTAFVIASHQTKGKGTYGRSWVSPQGAGIYLSVIHLPKEKRLFTLSTLYTLSAGIACVEAIKEVTKLETKLKPINDIYVNNKKLGGILIESELQKDGISALVTGIGINTHNIERSLDKNLILPISLEELLPSEEFNKLSINILTETIIEKICYWHNLIFQGEKDKIEQTWELYKLSSLPHGC